MSLPPDTGTPWDLLGDPGTGLDLREGQRSVRDLLEYREAGTWGNRNPLLGVMPRTAWETGTFVDRLGSIGILAARKPFWGLFARDYSFCASGKD